MTKGDNVIVKDKQKFDLSSLVIKWKSKSEKRWNKLKKEDKLKNNLELYTTEVLNNKLDFGIVNR
jgi:alanine dehydrogenase